MSSKSVAPPDSIRFGDDFELDVRAYQLRSGGVPLKLKPIQLNLLLLLVQHRGELVSRGQIVEHIWGKGVFLDADNSINGAISKIRQVLRDNAEHPRFIETVTGVGYRFIAPTEELSGPPLSTVPASPSIDIAETSAVKDVIAPKYPFLSRWRLPVLTAAVITVVALGAYLHWSRSQVRQPARPRLMLAVLPFENLTGDANQEYFSDGMTEEMISRLGNLDPQRLGVIARSSVMNYKNSHAPLEQIGRELGVQYVLEGSVRRDADRVRIAAQLIQVKDQTYVWAQEYDRKLSTLLTVQGEIAQEIADEIQLALDDTHKLARAQQPLLSPQQYEAYDLYLQGRYLWNKRTREGLAQAIEIFQQAVNKDPQYARAYAGLADAYALTSTYGLAPPNENMPRARTAALKALELDERLPEAHTSLALICEFYDWDWQTAGKEFERAIQLDPNYATAHHWYAEYLGFQGRFDEARAESERAHELDPLSLIISADYGAILYYARDYDLAIRQFRAVSATEPKFARAHLVVPALMEKGMFGDAFADMQTWQRTTPNPWIEAYRAYAYGRLGEQRQALASIAILKQKNKRWHLDENQLLAVAYTGMGERDKALGRLEKALEGHSNLITSLKVDPLFDPLRSDPRFQELLRKARLDR